MSVDTLIGRIMSLIIGPIIGLLFILATLYFFWGGAVFILNADNEDERSKGKRNMIWGITGMFIMTAAYGIITVIANTFEISLP